MSAARPQSHPTPCPACGRCRQIAAAVVALTGEFGRPPTLEEIAPHLVPPLRGFGGMSYHIRALIEQGYAEKRTRYYGLYIVRPLETGHDKRG